jgi:asparagine synthetase B (glutamine-hydrolysing)
MDSSAVLALAVTAARRLGAPAPIPVTARYPGVSEADENEWQELVIAHLGLDSWLRLTITDQQTYLGSHARAALTRHGLLWPASVQVQGALYEQLDPGTLLTGEGGDEALGNRRITPVKVLLGRRQRPPRDLLAMAWDELQPAPIHRPLARLRASRTAPTWLRPAARAALARQRAHPRSRPLRWDRETRAYQEQRATAITLANIDAFAAEFGLAAVHPFFDLDFRAALAREGGAWGYSGRIDMMRTLFADLLPDAILARRSKASFNKARWGDDERDFLQTWDGAGLDDDLVDFAVLRDHLVAGRSTTDAGFYLQLGWLAATGHRPDEPR